MKPIIASILPLALLAACGTQPETVVNNDALAVNTGNATGGGQPEAVIADNATVTPDKPAASLTVYEGKYPYDEVAGRTFVQTDAVKAAIAASGADAKVRSWLNNSTGPASPIVLEDGKLVMNECQTHNCGDHNWTIAIAPDGTGAEICYYDAELSRSPRWFVDGKATERPARGDTGCIVPDA